MSAVARVTLLTDFGTRDGFVGALKGVLAARAPGVVIDDVSHDLAAGDVRAGTRALARYWARYPPGTVHLVVVDPGVGTARRPLACRSADRFLVGPDNGVLTAALRGDGAARCVQVDEGVMGAPVSATFHGRDVFAPVAAALAAGRALDTFGAPVLDPVLLDDPEPVRTGRGAEGEVVAVDHFGNLTTNLPGAWVQQGDVVELMGRRLRIGRTYGEVAPGEALALVDSEGRVEIAVRNGSAARLLGVAEGAPAVLLRS